MSNFILIIFIHICILMPFQIYVSLLIIKKSVFNHFNCTVCTVSFLYGLCSFVRQLETLRAFSFSLVYLTTEINMETLINYNIIKSSSLYIMKGRVKMCSLAFPSIADKCSKEPECR